MYGGIAGILFLAVWSYYTLIILAKCGHLTHMVQPTYPMIGREAFGRPGEFFAWFGIIAMTVGVCGSYFVFIGSSLSYLLIPYSSFFDTPECTCLILPIVVGLSWLRSLKWLSPTSFLGT